MKRHSSRRASILLSTFALVATLAGASSHRVVNGRDGFSTRDKKVVIQVFKSPTCGCCKEWVNHMRAAGFDAQVVDMTDEEMQAKKASLGVGPRLQSCHTAVVNGYVVEGHVRQLRVKPGRESAVTRNRHRACFFGRSATTPPGYSRRAG